MPALLALKPASDERCDRAARCVYWLQTVAGKVLQAEDFIDQQPGKHLVMFHHQYAPLLARRRDFQAKKTAQINDRQQTPAQIGHALYPGLDPRHQRKTRFVQHFTDFAHGRDVPLFAQAKTDAAPAVLAGGLGRQVRRQQATTPVDLQ
ncbi:hypothetical protein D3C76_1361360 [compost metagenome]